ncbi:hypothetical protein DRP04_06110 [Archaeoglobales archaeon]|nr:MAG: hypothetical protein DRP04_06110 [Archaeoglobales archaeon]
MFLCDNCKRKFQAHGTGAEPYRFKGKFRQDFLPVDVVSQDYFEKLRDAHEIDFGGEEDAPE